MGKKKQWPSDFTSLDKRFFFPQSMSILLSSRTPIHFLCPIHGKHFGSKFQSRRGPGVTSPFPRGMGWSERVRSDEPAKENERGRGASSKFDEGLKGLPLSFRGLPRNAHGQEGDHTNLLRKLKKPVNGFFSP